ncbi:hypothetical protein IF2G_01031 [Cordyceps javanica]|nr:hypothetical protein IF2G_01031 [Cordyceps javanica]
MEEEPRKRGERRITSPCQHVSGLPGRHNANPRVYSTWILLLFHRCCGWRSCIDYRAPLFAARVAILCSGATRSSDERNVTARVHSGAFSPVFFFSWAGLVNSSRFWSGVKQGDLAPAN